MNTVNYYINQFSSTFSEWLDTAMNNPRAALIGAIVGIAIVELGHQLFKWKNGQKPVGALANPAAPADPNVRSSPRLSSSSSSSDDDDEKKVNNGRVPPAGLFGAPESHPDVITMRRLAQEIMNLKPTIADADAYPFVKTYGQFINDQYTQQGALAALAAGMRAHAQNERYGDSVEGIFRFGRDFLRQKSGQCDHMAAAVIAKIVEHIRKGGAWSSHVELMGNGGHAFVVMNRGEGSIKSKAAWSSASVIDTWLGYLGVHPDYAASIPSPINGVLDNSADVLKFAKCFGALSMTMKVTRKITVEELHALAKA